MQENQRHQKDEKKYIVEYHQHKGGNEPENCLRFGLLVRHREKKVEDPRQTLEGHQ